MLDYILNIDIVSVKIFFLSMFPITEQRLTIPYFILQGENYWLSIVFLSMLGNITIGYMVYFIIGPVIRKINGYLEKIKIHYSFFLMIKKLFNKIITRTEDRGSNIRGVMGLLLFISIPLPLTGVWTGAFASYLFGLNKKDAILGITLGVIFSAIIVTSLTFLASEFWLKLLETNFDRLNLK